MGDSILQFGSFDSQSYKKSCSLLIHFAKGTPPVLANEIQEALKGNDVPSKIDAMKNAITLVVNGETVPQLFNTIVTYVLPSEDHTLQKLLLLYLEIMYETDEKERVLPEMILICRKLRDNLKHPNEYIRGATRRFLCRFCEVEVIEHLVPFIMSNLEHRNSYVRRNAILAVMSIYNNLPQGEELMDEAPEKIEELLSTEQDASAKRNAFLMLFHCAPDRMMNYLLSNADSVHDCDPLLQMAVLEIIRKVNINNKPEKGKYILIVTSLLRAPSAPAAVVYESAGILASLSNMPMLIRMAADTYYQLLFSQSDNNVKLDVLDRLKKLNSSHKEIIDGLIKDVLETLSSTNLDILRKTLDIVLELLTPHNAYRVVHILKEEAVRIQGGKLDENGEYCEMLFEAIRSCAVKCPAVASLVAHLLMKPSVLGNKNVELDMDVLVDVVERLISNFKSQTLG